MPLLVDKGMLLSCMSQIREHRWYGNCFMFDQLIELTRRIDTLMTEQNGKLQNMQGSNTQQMEEIDLKIKVGRPQILVFFDLK